MRGASVILEAILLLLIAAAFAYLAFPSAQDTIQGSQQQYFANVVRGELEKCNDKLLETSRTGSGNVCIFSQEVTVDSSRISFIVSSESKLCDEHQLTLINTEKSIWQRCNVDDMYTLETVWMSGFITFKVNGITGKELRFTRTAVSDSGAVLDVAVS